MEDLSNAALVIQQWWFGVRPPRECRCMMCNCILEVDGLCEDCEYEETEKYENTGDRVSKEELQEEDDFPAEEEVEEDYDSDLEEFMEAKRRFEMFMRNMKKPFVYKPAPKIETPEQKYRREMEEWRKLIQEHKKKTAEKEMVERMYGRIKIAGLKREIQEKAFAPQKVEAWLNAGGFEKLDEMFGDD